MNFLEHLLIEWLEIRGGFVRSNVRVGKLDKGGYGGELDVVAWFPQDGRIEHYEASTDAASWNDRRVKFEKKFKAGKEYIRKDVLRGDHFASGALSQYAVFAAPVPDSRRDFAGATAIWAGDLLEDINAYLAEAFPNPMTNAVPESFPLLRMLQFERWRRSRRSEK